ncbi:MAG: helix-turn-helix domain-containing protein [Candidatus Hydrogenedentes bacterium]|nr:helix-turn-helix domain-containing protein [Candidatus Hydrogenedentota bacterium]
MRESVGQLAGLSPARASASRFKHAPNRSSHAREMIDGISRHLREDAALGKLNDICQELSGLTLVILMRVDNEIVELHPAGRDECLPEFCQAYRSTVRGEERCRTCRSLVAFSACYRGLVEFACHGGVSVIAAPAVRRDGTRSERIVVAACLFAQQPHDQGWPLIRKYARDLGPNLKRLKQAYFELPAMSSERLHTVREVTEAAALLAGAAEELFESDLGQSGTNRAAQDLESCWPGIELTRDPSYKPQGGSVGSVLVGQVTAMVKRDPSMPFTVKSVAEAAHVTPNHFSMLFRKHTGQTFREFLSEQRCFLACDLLRDVRIPVGEVARRAGFRDSAYFSRRFKTVTGKSPTEWRLSTAEFESTRERSGAIE